MKNFARFRSRCCSRSPSRQRGVVLLFCLVILVILLAGGVAVVRSMNSSMFSAGNLAFKRDLLNQGEQAVSQVLRAFAAGGSLGTPIITAASLPSANYSAVELKTNARGIPEVLLKKGANPSGSDINGGTFSPAGGDIAGRDGVTIRYVIDRLCNAAGSFAALGNSRCVYSPTAASGVTGGTAGEDRPASPAPPLYRLSIRVDGPRDTQAFLQTSFSKPE